MKAIIFNSGLGSRMENLTKNNPKCLVKLYNGETILDRQIRILSECGIDEFVITIGPFKDQVINATKKYDKLKFTFVENNDYLNTNYIVSMDNANKYLNDDFLLLHGDLVFNKNLVIKMLESNEKSLCLYNENKDLPDKDFKGRFKNNVLKEVSINIFDDDCYAFQPLYKLDKETLFKWKNNVRKFVENGNVKVYAENSLNEITDSINIIGMSYKDDYIDEIDNENDYIRVSNEIKYYDYREQIIINSNNYSDMLEKYTNENENVFIVCGKNLKNKINNDLCYLNNKIYFSDFSPNPKYEEIKKGIDLLKKSNCNKIISIGGGSSIDVAKCIKLFSTLNHEYDFLEKKYNYNSIIHIAIPTTAGTGSESTSIAVMYYKNKKLSIDHESVLPHIAILDGNLLKTLPNYQKKSTLLDSLCQAIESYWSKGSTKESKSYSKKCIEIILKNYKEYIDNNSSNANYEMLEASNYSGKAINISRTTAPHSMSYILTSKYKITHGHAVSLCLVPCWKLLLKESKNNNNLKNTLDNLSNIFNSYGINDPVNFIVDLIKEFNLPIINIDDNDVDELVNSVNIERLNNNPIKFNEEQLSYLYKQIKNI